VRKKVKKRPAGSTRVVEEPASYASIYAAKLAKEVAAFAPRQAGTSARKTSATKTSAKKRAKTSTKRGR